MSNKDKFVVQCKTRFLSEQHNRPETTYSIVDLDILLSYYAIFLSQMLIFQFSKLILCVIVVEGFSVPVRYGVVWGKELSKSIKAQH